MSLDLNTQVAKHLREGFFGGNWTSSDLKSQLSDVSWKESISEVNDFNTIATLTYHIRYFVSVQLKVLKGNTLEGKDSESFSHPSIRNQKDWEAFLADFWQDTEDLAMEIERLPKNKLGEVFYDNKYGSYYRNLQGLIEHTHYHLGQIALLKKLVKNKAE